MNQTPTIWEKQPVPFSFFKAFILSHVSPPYRNNHALYRMKKVAWPLFIQFYFLFNMGKTAWPLFIYFLFAQVFIHSQGSSYTRPHRSRHLFRAGIGNISSSKYSRLRGGHILVYFDLPPFIQIHKSFHKLGI